MDQAHRVTVGRVVACALLFAATACARATRDGVIAHNELVSLELDSRSGTDELRLVPQPGVKINAELKPSIEQATGGPVVFDAPGRTADSAYFVVPPTARLTGSRPLTGTLRASACPEGKRVCLSVALPVALR
jgi:hypothetical protein